MASCSTLTVCTIVLSALGASAAGGQSASEFQTRRYQVPQRQRPVDMARVRAQADAKRAATEAERARAEAADAERPASTGGAGYNANYASSFRIPAAITDDFARTPVPVYQLPNGVRLRTSGDLRPAVGVRCVMNCESLRHP